MVFAAADMMIMSVVDGEGGLFLEGGDVGSVWEKDSNWGEYQKKIDGGFSRYLDDIWYSVRVR